MISVFDLAVLLWEEINSSSLLAIKGLSFIAYSIVILKLMSPIDINVPNKSNNNNVCKQWCFLLQTTSCPEDVQ